MIINQVGEVFYDIKVTGTHDNNQHMTDCRFKETIHV